MSKNRLKFLTQLLFTVSQADLGGIYQAEVARRLRVSRQRVSYWFNKLERNGYLKRRADGKPAFYVLTEAGKSLLKTCQEIIRRSRSYKGPVFRLHRFGVKFPVVKPPKIEIDWKKVKMQNWSKYVGYESELRVEFTGKHLIIWASELIGRNPNELIAIASLQCTKLALILESKFGMKLDTDKPELSGRPHFAILSDPIAMSVARYMTMSSEMGVIDSSRGYGELEYWSPEFVHEYFHMPRRVKNIEERLIKLPDVIADALIKRLYLNLRANSRIPHFIN